MSEMNDYSNPATPLMSEEKCETCTLKAKCSPLCFTCIYNKYSIQGLDDNYIKKENR